MKSIFIGACPRSGTTLVGTRLGNIPGVVVTPESHFKFDLIRLENLGASPEMMVDAVRKHRKFRAWEIDVPWEELLDNGGGRLGAAAVMKWLVGKYAQKNSISEPWLWVDHTPQNSLYIKALMDMFTSALFVHLVRDGRGVVSSVLPLDWGPNTVYTGALWWERYIAHGLAAELAYGERAVRVKYEDVLCDPSSVFGRLTALLGVKLELKAFETGNLAGSDMLKTQHKLVEGVLDLSRAHAWKKHFNRESQMIFDSVSGNLLELLGYEVGDSENLSLPARLKSWGVEALVASYRKAHYWVRWNMILRRIES